MNEKSPYDEKQIESENLSELMYEYDGKGNYTSGAGKYYVAHDQILLHDVLKRTREKLDAIRQKVMAGEISPVVYFMEKKHMEPGILAQFLGIPAWKVRRHFKPKIFSRLTPEMLLKYAETFEISADELLHFK
jgi:plasmid maintenance system antidote protein VapI